MSSIDERVVEAKFDNKQFQAGVKDTLSSLDNLKKGLNVDGAAKSFDGMTGSIDKVKQHIDVMRIATLVAVATIAHQAVRAGENLIKALTIDPVKAGLESYNEQINATQVILANTKAQGTTLKDVTATLADLQQYANLTVYSFSDMTSNIGKFTAAGVALGPATSAIKGMANVAALSGATTMQMSSAMYQMSQALSTGVIRLQDWNSLSNANMAGQNVQKALEMTAHSMGKAGDKMDAAIKKGGNFRNSLQQGWLTADIFTKTMGIMAGTIDKSTGKMKAFSVAQIEHMGYSKKDAEQLQVLSQSALDSAIKIRTIPQMMQALKEEVATAWGTIFKTVFGDINQATALFTGLHTTLENALTNPLYAFNKILQGWSKMGGRFALLDGLKLAFGAIGDVVKTVKAAFREIFPPMTAKELFNLTVQFHVFAENLKPLPATLDKIKRIFAGLFAVVDIFWQAIKAAAHFLVELLGTVGHTSKGLLDFGARIGDMLVALDQAIKKGQGFTKFFDALRKVLTPVISVLGITRIKVLDLANGLATGLHTFSTVLGDIPKVFHAISVQMHKYLNNIFSGFDFSKGLQLINAGLFGGLLLLVKKFLDRGKGKTSPLKGFIDKITEPFDQLTNTLKTMQQTLQAAALVEIAIAVGVLTASVVALSLINSVALAKALGAMSVMFAQLFGALFLFNKVGGAKGLSVTSVGLILFATAIRVLTSSVEALAKLNWEQLAKGLVGVSVLIGGLILATKGMAGNAGGMIRTGAGLLLLAVAIKVLASAVADFAKLNWEQIAKGLVGVAGMLLALTLFTKFAAADKGGITQGAGLLLLAAGIKVLASAAQDFAKISWEGLGKGFAAISGILLAVTIFSKTVGNPVTLLAASASLVAIGVAMNILAAAMKNFAEMSWGDIAKGLASMAGALAIITIALDAMSITAPIGALALVAVSIALVAMAGALKIMGSMSWNDIAQSLVALGGALAIIAIAMDAMLTALPGAAALVIVAGALAILVPELALLGALSWGDLLKALLGLAAAFTIIGVAGALLTPVIPSLLGLAGSIALLGVGLALIGGAVYLFAAGLTMLSVAGAGAAAAIQTIFNTIVGLLPTLAKALGVTLVALAQAIAAAAPELLRTSVILIDGLLTAIGQEGPKIISTFFNLIINMLTNLANAVPRMASAAATLMLGVLGAITRNAGPIINKFTDMVISIISALTRNTPRFVSAVVNWIVVMLNSIAAHTGQMVTAGSNIVIALIQGLGKNAVRIANAAGQTILDFINGLDAAVNKYETPIIEAGAKLAGDIALGLARGLADIPMTLGKQLGSGLLHWAGKAVGRGSPAKEFIKLGQDINEGLRLGLVGSHQGVMDYWNKVVQDTKDVLSKSADDIKTYSERLKTLETAHHKNAQAISDMTAKLKEAEHEHNNAAAIWETLNKAGTRQYVQLKSLGSQYDVLTQKISNANDALKAAIQVRDDYNKSVNDQYNVLPDIASDTQLSDYETNLKKQIADTQTFTDVVGQLRKMGLDDAQYKDLISKGTTALPFAEQILAGGKSAIDELNTLDSQMQKQAATLATNASTALYQAGVNAAQGLVNGLTSKQKAVENEMTKIAQAMVAIMKKELKIKSPSEIFHDLGQFSGKGLADGLTASFPHIQKATKTLGKNTVESMKAAILEMNDLLSAHTDMNPTIKPVLDLSAVRQQAGGLGQILSVNAKRIAMDAAYSKAMNASAGYEANIEATTPSDVQQPAPASVTMVQNNYSPKALTTAEIYRQTNNQLSRARGVLRPDATPVR